MNRYCIVHIPEGDIEKYFNEITSDLDEKFQVGNLSKRILQHITIRYPFEATEEEVLKIEETIRSFASTQKSFNYMVEGFGKLGNGKTIFLSIPDDTNMVNFRNGLMEQLQDLNTKDPFSDVYHPHISIARSLTEESSTQCWEYLTGRPQPHFDLMFNSVSIIVKNDDVWSVYKKISFA